MKCPKCGHDNPDDFQLFKGYTPTIRNEITEYQLVTAFQYFEVKEESD